jgi:hypothetical protein
MCRVSTDIIENMEAPILRHQRAKEWKRLTMTKLINRERKVGSEICKAKRELVVGQQVPRTVNKTSNQQKNKYESKRFGFIHSK